MPKLTEIKAIKMYEILPLILTSFRTSSYSPDKTAKQSYYALAPPDRQFITATTELYATSSQNLRMLAPKSPSTSLSTGEACPAER
jgi:hypothetical protein